MICSLRLLFLFDLVFFALPLAPLLFHFVFLVALCVKSVLASLYVVCMDECAARESEAC